MSIRNVVVLPAPLTPRRPKHCVGQGEEEGEEEDKREDEEEEYLEEKEEEEVEERGGR